MAKYETSLEGRTAWFKDRTGAAVQDSAFEVTFEAFQPVRDGMLNEPALAADPAALASIWESQGPFPDTGFSGIGRITQIACHPTDSTRLIAGAAGGGVWGSSDGGATWTSLMQLHSTLTIGAVAIAPSDPSVMYVASGEDAGSYNPSWPGMGLYRSNDSGRNWVLMTALPSKRFSAIVVHPTRPDTIYLAGHRGLHKSIDGGRTWLTNPGQGSLFDGQVTDVVIAHDTPDRVYIGVHNRGVFRSVSGGQSSGGSAFEALDGNGQLPSGFAAGWIKIAIGCNGADGSNFLAVKMGESGARIFTTTNAGDGWTELAANVATAKHDEWCSVIAVSPDNQDVMFAGAATAFARTRNGGASAVDWQDVYRDANNEEQVHADQQDIAFDPNDSNRIYLANDGGVYLSEDGGSNWAFQSTDLAITQCYDLDISENDVSVVACGGQDVGVFYRNPAGQWTNIAWGDGTQVAIDPADPNIFYFSPQNGVPKWLRKSKDGGVTVEALGQAGLSGSSPWVTIMKLEPDPTVADPFDNRVLFVCGHHVLFRSDNGGQTWQRVEDANGQPFRSTGEISALEFAPGDTRILYMATADGVIYRATNGGAVAGDWQRIDNLMGGEPVFPDSRVLSLAVHPTDSANVWAVFGGQGVRPSARHPDLVLNPSGFSHVFQTSDGGNTWKDVSGRHHSISLPDVATSAVALAEDPFVAFVGTDVGVFRTTTKGETWDSFQDGMPRSPVMELRLNRSHRRLFAATMGRGVYSRAV